MLTPRQAFKAGFALRCAELNLGVADLERVASRPLPESVKTAGVMDSAGSLLGHVAALGLALPPIAGYATGYLGARIRDADVDTDDLKNSELAAEYRRLAAVARRVAARKKATGGGGAL